jgi:hypothetical protein
VSRRSPLYRRLLRAETRRKRVLYVRVDVSYSSSPTPQPDDGTFIRIGPGQSGASDRWRVRVGDRLWDLLVFGRPAPADVEAVITRQIEEERARQRAASEPRATEQAPPEPVQRPALPPRPDCEACRIIDGRCSLHGGLEPASYRPPSYEAWQQDRPEPPTRLYWPDGPAPQPGEPGYDGPAERQTQAE